MKKTPDPFLVAESVPALDSRPWTLDFFDRGLTGAAGEYKLDHSGIGVAGDDSKRPFFAMVSRGRDHDVPLGRFGCMVDTRRADVAAGRR